MHLVQDLSLPERSAMLELLVLVVVVVGVQVTARPSWVV